MNPTLSTKSIVAELPARNEADWLTDRRAEAVTRLAAGFPTSRADGWKGTNTTAFAGPWTAAEPATLKHEQIAAYSVAGLPHIAVLIDGIFSHEHSRLNDLPHEIHVESLAQATARGSQVLNEHLDRTGPRTDVFADWNMAGWNDGLFVTTAANVQLDSPLHILHVATGAGTIRFPRTLIHIRDGASVSVVEHHVGIGDSKRATIAVTELVAHPGANLRHDRIQEESKQALHMHLVFCRADKEATIARTDTCFGADHSRLTVEADLAGAGAHCSMDGFYLTGGKRHCDIWTRFDHAAPNTTSNEMVKGVLGDSARGAFTGNVRVRQVAQGTNAQQQNRNLLLSDKAHVDSQPQLEINADDVQCSHGSTVGQLDDEALFFLRSRGIGKDEATVLLTKAFLADAVAAMHPLIQNGINDRIEAWFERHTAVEVVA